MLHCACFDTGMFSQSCQYPNISDRHMDRKSALFSSEPILAEFMETCGMYLSRDMLSETIKPRL